jgi:CheY-like chemotaxis protein
VANKDSLVILMADDDEDDILLTQKALERGKLINPLYTVQDGEALLETTRMRRKRRAQG